MARKVKITFADNFKMTEEEFLGVEMNYLLDAHTFLWVVSDTKNNI